MPMCMLDLKSNGRLLLDKSLYALGVSSELLLTPDDTLLLTYDSFYAHNTPPRKRAVFHHKASVVSPLLDVAWPAFFVDKETVIICACIIIMAHQSNLKMITRLNPLLLYFLVFLSKASFLTKKNVDIWRSKAQKLKMVQPYDIFLSDPHISASGIIGAALTACFWENSVRSYKDTEEIKYFSFYYPTLKSALLGGPTQLAQDILNSCQPSLEAVKLIHPTTTFFPSTAGPWLSKGCCLVFSKASGVHGRALVF
ncbi:hypothetical protein DITRI_Ditri15bG0143300 [Diplodiscus trichospermus]